jgi:hypothetical protein
VLPDFLINRLSIGRQIDTFQSSTDAGLLLDGEFDCEYAVYQCRQKLNPENTFVHRLTKQWDQA